MACKEIIEPDISSQTPLPLSLSLTFPRGSIASEKELNLHAEKSNKYLPTAYHWRAQQK